MDNIPEYLKDSSKYYARKEDYNNLENAVDSLRNSISNDDIDATLCSINDVINYIYDAIV